MKALLFLLLTFSFFSFAGNVEFPKELEPLLDPKKMAEVASGIIRGNDDKTNTDYNKEHFTPRYVKEDIIDIGEMFYTNGIARLEDYEQFKCKVLELINIEKIIDSKPESIGCSRNYFNRLKESNCYKDAKFEDYFTIVNASKSEFNLKYKCEGAVTVNLSDFNAFFEYKRIQQIIGVLGTPQRQFYFESYRAVIGKFLSNVKSNTKNKVGEYEMASANQCVADTYRFPFAGFKKPAFNSCKLKSQTCSSHGDCCSMNCVQPDIEAPGTCMQEMSCYRLLSKGESCGELAPNRINPYCDNAKIRYALDNTLPKPEYGAKMVQCIPTNFETSEIGECTAIGETPTSNKPCCSDKMENGKCVDNFTCAICYRGGESPGDQGECCPGFWKRDGKCIQDFPPLLPGTTSAPKRSILKKIIDILLPSAFADVIDREDEADGDQGATQGGSSSASQPRSLDSSLLSKDVREGFDKERNDCFSGYKGKDEDSQKGLQGCLQKVASKENEAINKASTTSSDNNTIKSRSDYISIFNRPVILSKKGSDFKNCEFHSFNDSWNSASDSYRNAEMVMMGFEYIYSGKGTEDYWLDGNGKSMFARGKAISEKLRANRAALIKTYNQIDKKMEEECKAFFSDISHSDGSTSVTDFKDTSMKDADGNITETYTNIETELGSEKKANLANIDRGASGVKHMQMITRFTKLRRNAQMVNFANNADLEAELKELADYIEKNRWSQDTPIPMRNGRVGTHLYDFTVRKLKSWVTVLLVIIVVIAVAALIVFSGGSGLIALGAVFSSGGAAVTMAGAVAAIATAGTVALTTIGIVGGLALVGLISSATWNGSGPNSGAKVSENLSRQAMYGDKTREVKDILKGEANSGWFHKKYFYSRHYLTPYFDARAQESDMKTGAQRVSNDKYCKVFASSRVCFRNIHAFLYKEDGITPELRFLLDVKVPAFSKESLYDKDTKFIQKVNDGYTRGWRALYATKPSGMVKQRFKNTNPLDNPLNEIKFMPDQGQWKPKIFDATMANDIIKSAAFYANCLEFTGDCENSELDSAQFGFGYLFSDEADAKAFGEYVFQHHFLWPSLASTNYMAYPSMALSSYMNTVAHYLSLIGSLSATRAGSFNDLASKYENYLMDLEGEYTDGSGAYNGRGSENAEFSKEFYKQFSLLDFNTGSGVEAFLDKKGVAKAPEEFNQAEKELFVSSVNKALRAKKQKEKYDNYQETVGKTERGKLKIKAQSNHLQSFGRPIDRLSESLRQGLTPVTAQAAISESEQKTQSKYSTYNAPEVKYPTSNTSSYGGYNGSSSSGSSASSSRPKSGLSERAKNSILVNSADKMKADLVRDDGDSLFKILTKAYFRNLDLVLERTVSAQSKTKDVKSLKFEKKSDTISNDKKSELRDLLSQ